MTPDKLSLRPDGTALLVIDVQDKLAAAMPEDGRARTLRNLSSLIEGARLFWMPVLFTEQYPQGLGHTVPELARLRDGFDRAVPVVEKREFSATANPGFMQALEDAHSHSNDGSIRTVVVAGMESHICVYQTVRGLLDCGFQVHVPWDATCSRDPANVEVARDLWDRAGAVVTSTETVLFDLLRGADHPHFKAISKLIR